MTYMKASATDRRTYSESAGKAGTGNLAAFSREPLTLHPVPGVQRDLRYLRAVLPLSGDSVE